MRLSARVVADALRGEESLSSEIAPWVESVRTTVVDVVDAPGTVVEGAVVEGAVVVGAVVVGGLVGVLVGALASSVARWPWPP